MPRWVMHEGTGHLLRSWVGLWAHTECGKTVRVKAADFREPKTAKGERDCYSCMERKAKGE